MSFSNEARRTLLQEYVWAVPSADELLYRSVRSSVPVLGAYGGTSGDSTASIWSEPFEVTMPGATTSVCTLISAVIDGQGLFPGAICLGASGDRFLGVMVTLFDAAVDIAQDQYVAVMTPATGKAFA